MGRYIDWSDVVAKYPDVAKLNDANELEDMYVPAAEGYIQGSLSSKYSDELLLQSFLVKSLMVDQVYKDIQTTRQPKKAEALYKSIENTIKAIVTKRKLLVDSGGNILSYDRSVVWSNTKDYTPVFGMSSTEDSIVDPDQLDDESDAYNDY